MFDLFMTLITVSAVASGATFLMTKSYYKEVYGRKPSLENTNQNESDLTAELEKARQYSQKMAAKERVTQRIYEEASEQLQKQQKQQEEDSALTSKLENQSESEQESDIAAYSEEKSTQGELPKSYFSNTDWRVMKQHMENLNGDTNKEFSVNTENPALDNYLRGVVYRQHSVSFDEGPYVMALLEENEKHTLTLLRKGSEVFSADIDMDNRRILSIDFKQYGSEKRYLVRYFFETFLAKQLDALIAYQIQEKEIIQKRNPSTIPAEESVENASLKEEMLRHRQEVVSWIDKIIAFDLESDMELKHRLEHHYMRPINDIVETYLMMQLESKKQIHQDIVDALRNCSAYLQSIWQSYENRQLSEIKGQLQLLNVRLPI